jgi:hypothetical protein
MVTGTAVRVSGTREMETGTREMVTGTAVRASGTREMEIGK